MGCARPRPPTESDWNWQAMAVPISVLYTCTPMFIAALYTIARTWKQPRCPSTDEWIRRLRNIYTTEYYSARKRDAFESVTNRWMKLEPIIQVSQKEKHKYFMLNLIGRRQIIIKTIKRTLP